MLSPLSMHKEIHRAGERRRFWVAGHLTEYWQASAGLPSSLGGHAPGRSGVDRSSGSRSWGLRHQAPAPWWALLLEQLAGFPTSGVSTQESLLPPSLMGANGG